MVIPGMVHVVCFFGIAQTCLQCQGSLFTFSFLLTTDLVFFLNKTYIVILTNAFLVHIYAYTCAFSSINFLIAVDREYFPTISFVH